MLLKNSLASDFITRPTRGLAWAWAEVSAKGDAPSSAQTAASAAARRVNGRALAMGEVSSFVVIVVIRGFAQTFARTFAIACSRVPSGQLGENTGLLYSPARC